MLRCRIEPICHVQTMQSVTAQSKLPKQDSRNLKLDPNNMFVTVDIIALISRCPVSHLDHKDRIQEDRGPPSESRMEVASNERRHAGLPRFQAWGIRDSSSDLSVPHG